MAKSPGKKTGKVVKGITRNSTSKSKKAKVGKSRSNSSKKVSPKGFAPETLPTCAANTACVIGRNKAGELVCWDIPSADKLVRSEDDGSRIYFSNT